MHNNFLKKQEKALKAWAIVLIEVVLCFLLLFSLGILKTKAPDFKAISSAAQKIADPKTTVRGDEMTLRKNYGLAKTDYKTMFYQAPVSAMEASEILIIEFADETAALAAKDRIEATRESKANMFKNYKPGETAILNDALLKVNGNVLIYVVSKDPKSQDAILASLR